MMMMQVVVDTVIDTDLQVVVDTVVDTDLQVVVDTVADTDLQIVAILALWLSPDITLAVDWAQSTN